MDLAADGADRDQERMAAESCRAYHERAFEHRQLVEGRASLERLAMDVYRDRLRVPLPPAQREAFRALADPDCLAVEVAHDGQLPHLGVVRMVVKADAIARADRRAVALYLIGDHYSHEMRPDNLHYGMPLKGQPPDAVKHPPRIRIGRANVHTPFRLLPPPTPAELEALGRQLSDFVGHNVGHERRAGRAVSDDAKAEVLARLEAQVRRLTLAAHDVRSLGDWLIRVQHDLFEELLGDRVCGVIFLPMSDVAGLLREGLTTLGASATAPRFWLHCPACKRRSRAPSRPGASVVFECPACRHRASMTAEETWEWLMPDIVAFETCLIRLGIDGWVVGSRADYHPEIERTYLAMYGTAMPPKFLLASVPRFRGIGDPSEGYGRTRLARAFLEMEPATLAAALNSPWTDDPSIRSRYLPPG